MSFAEPPDIGAYQERWCEARSGRFVSRDPIHATNLYSYALNAANRYMDPLGLDPTPITEVDLSNWVRSYGSGIDWQKAGDSWERNVKPLAPLGMEDECCRDVEGRWHMKEYLTIDIENRSQSIKEIEKAKATGENLVDIPLIDAIIEKMNMILSNCCIHVKLGRVSESDNRKSRAKQATGLDTYKGAEFVGRGLVVIVDEVGGRGNPGISSVGSRTGVLSAGESVGDVIQYAAHEIIHGYGYTGHSGDRGNVMSTHSTGNKLTGKECDFLRDILSRSNIKIKTPAEIWEIVVEQWDIN